MVCRVQERRLRSIWGERLGSLRVVAQAAIYEGLTLDAFPLDQDPFAASEVDVSGREVAEALMSSGMVVGFHEGGNPRFQFAGQVGVFGQGAVLERLVPALDLALRLRMARRTADVGHASASEPVGQVAGDAARLVVGEQAWPLHHPRLIEPGRSQRQIERSGDVTGRHRGAQLRGRCPWPRSGCPGGTRSCRRAP